MGHRRVIRSPNYTLNHILSACLKAQGQGHYSWRHGKVLQKTPEINQETAGRNCASSLSYQNQVAASRQTRGHPHTDRQVR